MLWLRVAAATAFIVLCTLLPFLPGRHDPLAVALSGLARVSGILGLLLVPAGALWLVADARRRRAPSAPVVRDPAGSAVLAVSAIVGLLVALSAFVISGLTLGIVAVGLWGYLVAKGASRLRRAPPGPRLSRATALSLVIVPIAVAALQFSLARPVTEWSRNRAIRNSAPLIADIEAYRRTHGRYPSSLLALWPDYQPDVIGVEQYHYEPSGDAYNVIFEHPSLTFGTREVVVYNPRDEHVMTSHAMDLLDSTGQALEDRRGHYAVHPAGVPGWKYFLFD
jgi:hypothetical protein